MLSMVRRLIQVNRRLSYLLSKNVEFLQDKYPDTVAEHLSAGCVVVDVGAGKRTPFADHLDDEATLIGVDIAEDELKHNKDLDRAIVCDISAGVQLDTASADLLCSRSVLEHIPDVEAFAKESFRVLRDGGTMVHYIPCRFAPFALLNTMLPNRLTKFLMRFTHEENVGICGFPTVYDHCWPSEIRRVFRDAGFEIESERYQFFQSRYYDFFFPLFCLSRAYDWVVEKLGVTNLCASMLIVARKPS
jgi:SAM-dependent methyltransferase